MSESTSKTHIIGIVGGIGSGKTAVAAEFAKLGCSVIDVDKLGHRVLELPEVIAKLAEVFGDSIVDIAGEISRKALGEIVFASSDKLAELESIVHPEIGKLLQKQIEAEKSKGFTAIVVDAAVLFEAGWDSYCSCTVFVDCPLEIRLKRVILTRNWTQEMLQSRESFQIPLDIKAKRCCYRLINSSNPSHLAEEVNRLFRQITQ